MTRIISPGTFDPLHHAHIWHLEWASHQGDELVVALTEDETVRAAKGEGRPFYTWRERAYCLNALCFVDGVVPHQGPEDVIARYAPGILVRGSVYKDKFPDQAIYEAAGWTVLFSPPCSSSHLHSTDLLARGAYVPSLR